MRRPLLLLAALALTGSVLAGCGDEGGDGEGESAQVDAVSLIRSSPAALEEAGSMRLEMTMEAAGQEITGEGQFDLDAQRGSLTMSLPAPLGTEIETIFDGTTYFMSAGLFGGAVPLPEGVEWIRFDLQELQDAAGTGIDLGQLSQSGASNPTDALSGLEAVAEDGVEELGTEEVRGVETTHYSAEIDMAAAFEQIEEQTGDEDLVDEDQAQQFLESFGDEPIATEIWIDDDGLVRRQSMAFTVQGQQLTQTMEMFDFGEPVEVEIPDEADSIDMLELLGDLGGDL